MIIYGPYMIIYGPYMIIYGPDMIIYRPYMIIYVTGFTHPLDPHAMVVPPAPPVVVVLNKR